MLSFLAYLANVRSQTFSVENIRATPSAQMPFFGVLDGLILKPALSRAPAFPPPPYHSTLLLSESHRGTKLGPLLLSSLFLRGTNSSTSGKRKKERRRRGRRAVRGERNRLSLSPSLSTGSRGLCTITGLPSFCRRFNRIEGYKDTAPAQGGATTNSRNKTYWQPCS